jgi:selenocysteine lyase/cysteine desulfurase
MTKLLEDAIEKVKELPKERQDELARMLIDVAASDLSPYQLTDAEAALIEERIAAVHRGEIASDEEVAAMWRRFGLV